MPRFFIENFGCRATEADASAIRAALAANGLAPEPEFRHAEVIVLNTCTVTAAADARAREAVRKMHRANPRAAIIVTGCYAQRAPEELAQLSGVAYVVGNSHQSQVGGIAASLAARDFVPLGDLEGDLSLAAGPAKILTGDMLAHNWAAAGPGTAERDRTRPILKIQDGCNNRCAYCVIPSVRGASRSLAPDAALEAVRRAINAGAKEIVLSGINLGSYGRDLSPKASLAILVRRILDETPLERLRFSSIEPKDVTEDFVSLAAASPRIAPHFHVPLQSGSDRVLRAMHRWYRAAHYAERINLIHRQLPDAAIGADVIAGFPGETEDDFQQTLSLIERLPFSYLHVFSFSARPGTEGARLPGVLPREKIRERARQLRALGHRKAEGFRAGQAGRLARALTLARQGDAWTEALTGNYLKLRIPGRHPANEWRLVPIAAEPQLA
ncbi:MAG TPA: tRNA (N(6)-L-threonylcarbamoyladenosine(37)-C(2))-methylthiotransferase MtaB [Candidatus Acidoferrales bacterium]|nr:tRNA (N(6)-L-threonylcarbamoyladenosine(37)-C(2))-methylthiotransferase MtaB [Candidatus Acidoferrales bacterium]